MALLRHMFWTSAMLLDREAGGPVATGTGWTIALALVVGIGWWVEDRLLGSHLPDLMHSGLPGLWP